MTYEGNPWSLESRDLSLITLASEYGSGHALSSVSSPHLFQFGYALISWIRNSVGDQQTTRIDPDL